MASQSNLLVEEWTSVQDQLSKKGIQVYPGTLVTHQNIAPWPDDRSFGEFLDFAEACERRIIYAEANKFSVEDSLELLLLLSGFNIPIYDINTPLDWLKFFGLHETEEGQDYIKRAGVHYGDLFRFSVNWMFEGVNHSYRRRAAWHDDMEDRAGLLVEMVEDDY